MFESYLLYLLASESDLLSNTLNLNGINTIERNKHEFAPTIYFKDLLNDNLG